MIQDIAPHVFHNEYRLHTPEKNSYVMTFEDGKIRAKMDGEVISFPTFEELEKENPEIYEKYTFLFEIDNRTFFLVQDVKMEGYELFRRNDLRYKEPQYLSFAAVTACQIYDWYQSHRYCGRCGSPMAHDKKERMMRCESCGQMEFPKICPAVIVGVVNGDRLLLSKYAEREYTKYALLAGFAEVGESIEDTVRREVMEEVGLKVKNITYYKSQPWSFTDTLLLGFYCEVDGDDQIQIDEEELAMAGWFERKDLPEDTNHISLTSEMIQKFKDEGAICLIKP